MTMSTDLSNVPYSERRRLAGLRALFRGLAELPAETKAAFVRVRKAHEAQAQLRGLPDEVLQDLDLSPEDIAGVRGYQPDLPFFMICAVGKRN